MSSSESDQPEAKYEFKGKFGAASSGSLSFDEASHEEIDSFVKDILGLAKDKK
jgi:hypothetical protein